MDLVPVQYCRSTEGWSPVQVNSKSAPGKSYTVLVNPYVTKREFVCDCTGFEFRGQCSHQDKALEHVCWWPMVQQITASGIQPIEQTDTQRKNKVCPKCGGPTGWELMDADDA